MPTPTTTQTDASFRRLSDGTWGIRVFRAEPSVDNLVGQTITVTRRDGSTQDITLGAQESTSSQGMALYRIARQIRVTVESATSAPQHVSPPHRERVTEPGVYELNGTAYIVKFNRQRTRLYANRVVEIGGTRQTEAGTFVAVEFVYDARAIYNLTPQNRMPYDRARELTIRYGRCICCGRHLRAGESVEQGIGPVCVRQFPEMAARRRIIQQLARAEASGRTARAAELRRQLGQPSPRETELNAVALDAARQIEARPVFEDEADRAAAFEAAQRTFEDEADEQAWLEKTGTAA